MTQRASFPPPIYAPASSGVTRCLVYPVILIGGDGDEAGLRKYERLEVGRHCEILVLILLYVDDMQTWLIFVH